MSNNEVGEVEEAALVYLSPLELVSVTAHSKKGTYGVYQDGYTVEFVLYTSDTKAKVRILAKKKSDWFAQMYATRIKNPNIKRFSFSENESGKLIVNGVLN